MTPGKARVRTGLLNKIGLLSIAACAHAAFAGADAVESETTEYRKGVLIKRLVFEKPRLMTVHIVRIDLATQGIGFTGTERDALWGRPMPDYTNGTWLVNTRRETTADFMARRRKEGRNVEIAVNTSGWRPWGGAGSRSTYASLYRYAATEGREVSCGRNPEAGIFFIVRKDGRVLIRPRVPVAMTNDIAIAMYGNRRIVSRGAATADADMDKAREVHPRTAFGLTADRKTLVILAVDGRQPGYSEGATCADLAALLIAEGCYSGMNMDGGGSTSLVVWDDRNACPRMLNRHARGYRRKVALNLGITFAGKDRDN